MSKCLATRTSQRGRFNSIETKQLAFNKLSQTLANMSKGAKASPLLNK